MSRFRDYDDYTGEPCDILAAGRWERNARVALKGKRGRQALALLREALLALPEKRLIEGAICTVGAASRQAKYAAEATRLWESTPEKWRPREPYDDMGEDLASLVNREGEGVCAVGAYAWYCKVKAGEDPVRAFASLPDITPEGDDAREDTAHLGSVAGLTFTLAWELGFRNDETYGRCTPEERYAKFLAWIDQELAGEAVAVSA